MAEEPLLHQLVRDQIEASRQQTEKTAVLIERVDAHLESDAKVHAAFEKRLVEHDGFDDRIKANEDFVKDFRRKVAIFAALVVGVWTFVGDIIKDVAVAAAENIFHSGGPPSVP